MSPNVTEDELTLGSVQRKDFVPFQTNVRLISMTRGANKGTKQFRVHACM